MRPVASPAPRTAAPSPPADERAEAAYVFPQSLAQQQLWLVDRLLAGRPVYNVASAWRLAGALEVEALQRALQELVRRHEALRTRFAIEDGAPVQVIAPELDVRLEAEDLESLPAAARAAETRRRAQEEAERPFDLEHGPLIRARLLRLTDAEYWLLLTLHHIVTDGWSLAVMCRELAALYGAFREGHGSPLPELPIQYADYALWQREWLRGDALEGQLAYWKRTLADLPHLELPTDRPRPATASYGGARVAFRLGEQLAGELRELGRREGATLFMTLAAALLVLLYRYSGQEDIALGFPTAGRTRPQVEGLIGYFVNMLVLRGDLSGQPTFRECLRRVRERTVQALEHQELPFARLVEELAPRRDGSRNPLFQVCLALENAPSRALQLPGLEAVPVDDSGSGTAKFDLSFSAADEQGKISVGIEYATDLFDAATIERMAAHWQVLLAGIAADPEQRISRLPLLTEAQRRQVLEGWNRTAREYGVRTRLHQLIEAQVRRTPGAVALELEGRELTYEEVDGRANRLARVLRRKGVGPDVPVGVFADRSFEMVVALLAVLKAGGAYVPLDPSYPQARLAHMLEDARAPLVLAQPHLAGRLPPGAARVLLLDSSWAVYAGESAEDLDDDAGTPESLAYVIFTSGSTGRPKGAMIEHRGIVNRLLCMQEQHALSGADRALQKTPFTFDVSVREFFWPLMTGARLVIALPEGHRDSAYLVRLIRERAITTLNFVPSMLRVFLEEEGVEACRSLKRVFCGGEPLTNELQERFFTRLPGAELHNLYGPTEAAVSATHWACRRGDARQTVPIGRPVANTQVYVLDRDLQPLPAGVAGELCIGGVQVGRGYVGRPDLTAERFVADPFSKTPGARLYKTGDLARHLPDGALEYLGRLDLQVKIRGQRIEPGEIEAVLHAHPGVAQSVVVAREDGPGDARIVAYVVAKGEALSAPELRHHLAQQLPQYMLPSAFVMLGEMPLTSSGKVDRKALPAPDAAAHARGAFEAPLGEAEATVARIWAEALKLERVGRHDNFFELGGHSLLAVQALTRVNAAFDASIPVTSFFEGPTVAQLASLLASQRDSSQASGPGAARPFVIRPNSRVAVPWASTERSG